MNIGQRVRTTSTGKDHVGQVVGIVKAGIYLGGRSPAVFEKWNDLFPNWVSDNIIYIELDKPQPASTLEEYANSIRQRYRSCMTDEEIEAKYLEEIKFELFVACPEEGVMLIDNMQEC